MKRSDFLWLLSLAFLGAFLVLEPLGQYPIFGSDTGEYFRLTSDLVTTGHLPLASYAGWGYGYQDFPGIFVLSGAVAGATGMDVLSSLSVVVPILSVLSVFPLFLLFRRLVGNDTVAVLGAGFATVAMPRLFSLAHPAPLALGDFFVVAALWMFVEGRRDRRWYFPLSVTGGALLVTHHLSSYFFLVSALLGLVLLELVVPGRWSSRVPTREIAFLGAFSVGLAIDWLDYARAFAQHVLGAPFDALSPSGVAALAGGIAVLFAGVHELIRWRRRRASASGRPRFGAPRLPRDSSVLRDLALLLAGVAVGVTALLFVPLPGTMQSTTLSAILFFSPLLAMIVLSAGTRRLLFFQRSGPFLLTWLAAVGLSAFVMLALSNPVVSPTRHAEYLLIPMGLLAAVGLGRLIARIRDGPDGRRRATAGALAVVVLLGANAAIAYPPPADFGGFQEGLTGADAAMWGWVGLGLPPNATVASDHRVSSMIFGFDGNPATWASTPALFTGSNWSSAASELADSYAPHDPKRPVNAVAIDATMYAGVALDPSQIAVPLSTAAAAWFHALPFVPLYENGDETVYWIDGPVAPT